MKRVLIVLGMGALLAGGGFSAALAANHQRTSALDSTTGTTGTSTGDTSTGDTTTTSTTETTGGSTVTLCHRTHSRKHPGVTITVGAPAAKAHLRHGDTLGPCPAPSTGTGSTDQDDQNDQAGQNDQNDQSTTQTTQTTSGTGGSGKHDHGRHHGHGDKQQAGTTQGKQHDGSSTQNGHDG